jgi:hypothetical protein
MMKFHVKTLNKRNAGKSADELIAQSARDFPDDPVEE